MDTEKKSKRQEQREKIKKQAARNRLITIVLMLRDLPDPGEKGYYYSLILSITSVVCSWILIHTVFTSHYAHLYYTCKTDKWGYGGQA